MLLVSLAGCWLWLVVGCPVGRLSGRGAAGWALFGGLWRSPPASPRSHAVRAWGSSLLGNLPLLFVPFLARLVSAPGCGVPSWLFGVSVSLPCSVAGRARGRLSPFLGWSVSFPLLSLIIALSCRVTRFPGILIYICLPCYAVVERYSDRVIFVLG